MHKTSFSNLNFIQNFKLSTISAEHEKKFITPEPDLDESVSKCRAVGSLCEQLCHRAYHLFIYLFIYCCKFAYSLRNV